MDHPHQSKDIIKYDAISQEQIGKSERDKEDAERLIYKTWEVRSMPRIACSAITLGAE